MFALQKLSLTPMVYLSQFRDKKNKLYIVTLRANLKYHGQRPRFTDSKTPNIIEIGQ